MGLRMNLPHGETDSRKTYSMPDPDALSDACSEAHHAVFPHTSELRGPPYPDVTLTYSQAVALLTLSEGYRVLTMHELGQEHCVEKLRDIWRARRARDSEDTPNAD